MRMASVAYHLASCNAPPKVGIIIIIIIIPLGGRGGALIFAKCEFNELHAQVMGGVMCGGFFLFVFFLF